VAQDTRTSSNMLFTALSSGLMSYGADVLYFGVLPTPGLSMLTRRFGADASVMVSASHNPMEDNGLKVLNSVGLKMQEAEEELLEQLMESDHKPVSWDHIGQLHYVSNSTQLYGDEILLRTQLPPMFYKKLEHGFIRSLQRLMATGLTMVVVLQIWSPLRKL